MSQLKAEEGIGHTAQKSPVCYSSPERQKCALWRNIEGIPRIVGKKDTDGELILITVQSFEVRV
jgi:hypothetical protein